MSSWSAARTRRAILALLVASLTAMWLGAVDPAGRLAAWPAVYVGVAGLAVALPAAIALQVIGGQLLVGALLVGSAPLEALALAPAVAGIVASAELLAAVARLDRPIRGASGDDVRRGAWAALVGGVAFAAVALVIGLPGPTGLVALVIAAASCVLLAIRMARSDP